MLSETKHCCSRKAARASQPQKVAWRTVSLVYCPVNSRDKFEHLSERREGVAAQRIQIHKSFASLTMTDHSYVANLRDTTLGGCGTTLIQAGFGKGTSLEGAEKRCFFRFSALRWGCARARAPRSPFISSFPTAPEHTSARALHRRYQLHHPHQVVRGCGQTKNPVHPPPPTELGPM